MSRVLQVSNRVLCMVNSFVLAGLLNRTLIASFQTHQQEHTSMDRHVFLDIEHLRSCYGENAIITAKEYKAKYGEAPVVDAVMCWGKFYGGCMVRLKRFRQVYTDMRVADAAKLEIEHLHGGSNARALFMDAFAGVQAKTLLISNVFYAKITEKTRGKEWEFVYNMGILPFLSLATCRNQVVPQPNSAIVKSAQLLIQSKPELETGHYLAVHMRRGDFKARLKALQPVSQSAEHVKRVSLEGGFSTVVLLTDGTPSEVCAPCSIFLTCLTRLMFRLFTFMIVLEGKGDM